MTHCSDFEFFSPRANPQLTMDQATPSATFPMHMAPQQIWGSTVFGVSGCLRTGLCGLVATHFGCPLCMSASWIFSRSHQGEERARIPAEFRARVFKPLGVSDALREGLKTASGGRLASSAGV